MRLDTDLYYLNMLTLVAGRSTCIRRAVGAIITDSRHRVLSTGYNGVPSGLTHCTYSPCAGAKDPSGDSRRCAAVHAEVNAILQCHDIERASIIYVSCTPCYTCAKMIANTNIKLVICAEEYTDVEGMKLFTELNIQLRVVR